MKVVEKLSPLAVKNAATQDRAIKLFDGGGMYLLVQPGGAKYWRLKFRAGGTEKLLALGVYPEVSLKKARELARTAREQMAQGIDPAAHKKAKRAAGAAQAANSFRVVAEEFLRKQTDAWCVAHHRRAQRRLKSNVYPWLGVRPVAEITPAEILPHLERIQERGAIEEAHRVRSILTQIFRYAIVTGRANLNPSLHLQGALRPTKHGHLAAIVDPIGVGKFLRAIDCYQGGPIVRGALQLAPLVFVRPGELRSAKWADIDLDAAKEWTFRIPKTGQIHTVPLSRQAIRVLRDLHALTGAGIFVFPSPRTDQRPISANAVLVALRALGYQKTEMSGHGVRAMARTLLDEQLRVRVDLIEHQLGHAVKDPLGRAYNRTTFMAERRDMMQAWADYLDKLRTGDASG